MVPATAKPLRRQPSAIVPEVKGSNPFSFPILVQPVLENNCVACHTKRAAEGKNCPDLSRGAGGEFFNSYNSLRNFTFFWDNASFDNEPDSKPGQIGARRSKLYQMLVKGHHDLHLSPQDMHRLTLWMDCNSDFYGSYQNLDEQKLTKVVWPGLLQSSLRAKMGHAMAQSSYRFSPFPPFMTNTARRRSDDWGGGADPENEPHEQLYQNPTVRLSACFVILSQAPPRGNPMIHHRHCLSSSILPKNR